MNLRWLAALALGACASEGCPPATGSDVISSLTCQSDHGNLEATLELGKRYEFGLGVPSDLAQAARLYRQAAAPRAQLTYIYVPRVGHSAARVLPVRHGQPPQGLAEAQFRLAKLYLDGRGVKHSTEYARELLEKAAARGYGEAIEALAALPAR